MQCYEKVWKIKGDSVFNSGRFTDSKKAPRSAAPCECFGAGDWNRTHNLLITNQLLCQLSYTSEKVSLRKLSLSIITYFIENANKLISLLERFKPSTENFMSRRAKRERRFFISCCLSEVSAAVQRQIEIFDKAKAICLIDKCLFFCI